MTCFTPRLFIVDLPGTSGNLTGETDHQAQGQLCDRIRIRARSVCHQNTVFRACFDIDLIDTGANTNTGGRLRRLRPWLHKETFMLTYGDGVSDVDVAKLLDFHKSHGRIATVSAVRPPARFGGLVLDEAKVEAFTEKPQTGEGWINGGFMVFEPGVFDYLDSDGDSLEIRALERLAADDQLMAYRHESFWQCMDTVRDKRTLESLWATGDAPWRMWT